MAGETKMTLIGNLADNPTLQYTDGGAAVVNMTVIANEKTYDSTARVWRDGDSLSMPCVAWRQYAENIAASLTKGTRVIVTGTLKQRSYQPADGPRRIYTELLIDEVGPALRFATAEVAKAAGKRPATQQAAPAQGAPAATWPPRPTTPPAVNPWPTPAMAG
ncbi:single-stranded DNA-binding protein [Kitasatospora sp. NPDC056446]|uniref:single-stranded DNA-binding protein n=1 Tax=Kitasatospora sp. NPDC056446 TaxID=3345819 RepID=UPI003682710F